jgi:hypothetical protein
MDQEGGRSGIAHAILENLLFRSMWETHFCVRFQKLTDEAYGRIILR